MSNISKMYWLTRLDSIQGLFVVLLILAIIALVIYYVGYSMSGDYSYGEEKLKDQNNFVKEYGWLKKTGYPLFISSVLILTFLPNKDDMIQIYVGSKAMDFVQQDTSVNKLPYQATKAISDFLDKKIHEINNK